MRFIALLIVFAASVSFFTDLIAQSPRYQSLFNGTDLSGWKGLDRFWSVRGGSIVGESTAENSVKPNTFLVWDGEVGDFELKCLVRFQGNNSGVQYRSSIVDPDNFALAGYQADLHPRQDYMGMMYGEKTGRGIIATGGQRVRINPQGESSVVAHLPLLEAVSTDEWNELRIVAVGNRMIHQINGVTTVDVTDEHADATRSGKLGLQLHQGPAMKAEFRSLLMRELDAQEGTRLILQLDTAVDDVAEVATRKATAEVDLFPAGWPQQSPKPTWVWADESRSNQKVWFRKPFKLRGGVRQAKLYATCDNRMKVFINGGAVAASDAWESPVSIDVTKHVSAGDNLIAIAGQNQGGIAALVAKMVVVYEDGKRQNVLTDGSWIFSEKETQTWNQPSGDASGWSPVKLNKPLGVAPWGVPDAGGGASGKAAVLNPRDIHTLPGFVVETVYVVPKSQGSWVSLAVDPKGRIYACDQGGAGLYRLTLSTDAEPSHSEPKVEKVSVGKLADLSGAQGLHWSFDSLWFHRNGGNLYRLRDSDGDDVLDELQKYPGTTTGGEHGNHAILTTPDGEGLFMDAGNASNLAEYEASRVPTWYEGHIVSRMWDSNGHARGRLAPGGWVTRLDIDSGKQTVYTVGFRNQYDIALNRQGDLFTYDADMEWDLGLPWYRPTRICFVASGADYGWRSGSGKWPTYYEDSLPPVVEIGPGSPTGVVSASGAEFPTRYRDALYASDWTFGTMYAIHMRADGAGYQGEAEPFLYGAPLPLTDVEIGHDGAMYFAVGGRGTQSGLYRVRYVGDSATSAPQAINAEAAVARSQRRELEAYHGVEASEAIDVAWPHLASSDRFLRHAARIAVESQPVDSWARRVKVEPDPQGRITATVALARRGTAEHREDAVAALLDLDATSLNDSQRLGLLRGYALILDQLGRPSGAQAIVDQVDALWPSENADVNTEVIRLMVALRDSSVIGKAMDLINDRAAPTPPRWSGLAERNRGYGGAIMNVINSNPPQREIMYAFLLREVKDGWTLQQRRDYFQFLNQAAKASGGASYSGYLTRIRDEALANCSSEQRLALKEITGEDFNPVPDFPIVEPKGPGQKWTVQTVLQSRGKSDFERGRSLFFSAKCAACHRLRGLGGAIGPDLTSIPNKFDERYLAEAIVDPSKIISDQYGSSRVLTEEGQVLTGLVIKRADGDLTIYPIDENAKEIQLDANEVVKIEPSKVSQMPEGLLDRLNPGEVRDLMAYLMSGGNPNDKRYRNK